MLAPELQPHAGSGAPTARWLRSPAARWLRSSTARWLRSHPRHAGSGAPTFLPYGRLVGLRLNVGWSGRPGARKRRKRRPELSTDLA